MKGGPLPRLMDDLAKHIPKLLLDGSLARNALGKFIGKVLN